MHDVQASLFDSGPPAAVTASQFQNVFTNSAEAVSAILALHFPTGTIVDVNFGHGVFYQKVTREIVGVDLKPTGNIVADNKQLPFADDSFDVGVIDPPYKRGGDNDRYTERYGDAPNTEQKSTRSYFAALPELIRVSRTGLIIKCQDASDGHAFYARHAQIMDWMWTATGLKVHDIVTIVRYGVPDANTQGSRRFFQQAISYFLIYKWRTKDPFRPVRY